jgi:hypothetical protein
MGEIPENSWLHRRGELEAFARVFDDAARLKPKRSRLWGVSGALKEFATTLGSSIYIPDDWTYQKAKDIIPHESAGHVRQFRWCGLGMHPSVGLFPGMFLIYIWGGIFPVYLAWARYRLELHADTQSWRYHLKTLQWTPYEVRRRAEWFAGIVASSAYAWAWPRRWVLWGFKRRAEKVIKGCASAEA